MSFSSILIPVLPPVIFLIFTLISLFAIYRGIRRRNHKMWLIALVAFFTFLALTLFFFLLLIQRTSEHDDKKIKNENDVKIPNKQLIYKNEPFYHFKNSDDFKNNVYSFEIYGTKHFIRTTDKPQLLDINKLNIDEANNYIIVTFLSRTSISIELEYIFLNEKKEALDVITKKYRIRAIYPIDDTLNYSKKLNLNEVKYLILNLK